jgi:hypothetical protein
MELAVVEPIAKITTAFWAAKVQGSNPSVTTHTSNNTAIERQGAQRLLHPKPPNHGPTRKSRHWVQGLIFSGVLRACTTTGVNVPAALTEHSLQKRPDRDMRPVTAVEAVHHISSSQSPYTASDVSNTHPTSCMILETRRVSAGPEIQH